MRNIHLFETVSAFTESYEGEGYLEPWVSYTRENTHVDYNKPEHVWFRVPTYLGTPDSLISDSNWTTEEVNLLNDFFEYFIPVGGYSEGWHMARIKENTVVELYKVSGIISGFDKNDSSSYSFKYEFTSEDEIWVYFGDNITSTIPNNNVLVCFNAQGVQSFDSFYCQYDFSNDEMVRMNEFYGDIPNGGPNA